MSKNGKGKIYPGGGGKKLPHINKTRNKNKTGIKIYIAQNWIHGMAPLLGRRD